MRCSIVIGRNLDARLRAAGMDYLASSDIDGHMIYGAPAVGVKYQISRLQIPCGNLCTASRLGTGMMRQGNTELLKHA